MVQFEFGVAYRPVDEVGCGIESSCLGSITY